jgi:ankyrin repeat protein
VPRIVKARNEDGDTALTLAAAYNKNPEVIATLLKAGAELEATRIADVNAQDMDGATPLMFAAGRHANSSSRSFMYWPKSDVRSSISPTGAPQG